MRKSLAAALVIIVLAATLVAVYISTAPKPEGRTLVVPDDYSTIQEAIGNATAGDTVFVKSGTYHEDLFINKTLSLIGENNQNTIIQGVGGRWLPETTVEMVADNILVSGFTVTGNLNGIALGGSGCRIIDNNVANSVFNGIDVGAENIIVMGNTISENAGGIYVSRSSGSIISNNTISKNEHLGIIVDSGANLTISKNLIVGNSKVEFGEGGLQLSDGGPFYVYGNNITDNYGYGVEFAQGCYNASVYQNNIINNSVGVKLLNFAYRNASLIGSGNIVWANNFIINLNQTLVEKAWKYSIENYTGGNGTDIVSWDNSKVGNYWSDYNGQGTYNIDQNNVDHQPLTQQVDTSFASTDFSSSSMVILAVSIVIVLGVVGLVVYFKRHKRQTKK